SPGLRRLRMGPAARPRPRPCRLDPVPVGGIEPGLASLSLARRRARGTEEQLQPVLWAGGVRGRPRARCPGGHGCLRAASAHARAAYPGDAARRRHLHAPLLVDRGLPGARYGMATMVFLAPLVAWTISALTGNSRWSVEAIAGFGVLVMLLVF